MRPKGPWHPASLGSEDNGKKSLRLRVEDATDWRDRFIEGGLDGSGLDWEVVLSTALKHRDRAVWSAITFDSEADCFVATAKDPAPLEILGQLIKDLLHNRHSLEKAIHDR